ncbi:TIR domain-containing adapter molecule 1 [Megalops cyprinoides]|uniref:TIR domain-containing adapter molecule 1 n=1 Tax=Megalops cyprinoides TaxID=118141 RepID=UPI001864D7A5|nr:TIR domain-containing adapter molecule 1 [Megalops cyprinoides]
MSKEREAAGGEVQRMGAHRSGASLKDAFGLLSHASRERLLSLTFKVGHSQAEELVHAMSLIILRKEAEALGKLQTLGNNKMAKYLAEMVTRCRSRQEDFRMDSELQVESQFDILIELARIFQVLTEERLCSESVRDKAYQAALRAYESMTGCEEGQGNMVRLMEEAREVCGPQFDATIMGTTSKGGGKTLKSLSGLCSFLPFGGRALGRGSAAMCIKGSSGDSSWTGDTRISPSSLRTNSSSCMSFPSHLEVSMSPTMAFDLCNINRGVQDLKPTSSQISSKEVLKSTLSHSNPEKRLSLHLMPQEHSTCNYAVEENVGASICVTPSRTTTHHKPESTIQCFTGKAQVAQCTENSGSHQIVTSKNADTKIKLNQGRYPEHLTETFPSTPPPRSKSSNSETQPKTFEKVLKTENKEEEDDTQFFSFVILHSTEDVDMAEKLKEKLEGLVIGTGATFSQDFAVPGQHTLTCVADAIDNSAFTILLLSRNFNPRLLEFKTNSALMNSIENHHKINTVIPFLPRENSMSRSDIPKSLRTLVHLHEDNKNFERMVKKAMTPDKIKKQRDVWSQEQRIQMLNKKQERLREDNERNKDFVNVTTEVSKLEQEQMQLCYKLQEQMWRCWPLPYPSHAGQAATPVTPPIFYPYIPGPSQQQPTNPEGQTNMGVPFGFQQPGIHIQNASCIMIGNDSQMTVGTGVENPNGEKEVKHTIPEGQEPFNEDSKE